MALNMKTKLLYLFIFFLAGCAVVAPERVEIPSLVHVASRELPPWRMILTSRLWSSQFTEA